MGIVVLGLAVGAVIHTTIQLAALQDVRTAFGGEFAVHVEQFDSWFKNLRRSLRSVADAVSTHGRLPDVAAFERVSERTHA